MGTETISQILRRRRRELGLSQEDLADEASLSANYIAKLETGVREPGLKALMRLAEVLEIPKDEIMNVLIHLIQNLLLEIGRLIKKNGQYVSRNLRIDVL